MIKFRLEKWEKAVVFQILEQESFERGDIYKNENFSIKVSACPELLDCSLVFLRGWRRAEDFLVSSAVFDTNAARDEYYDKILKAFSDWKKSMKTKSIETKEQNIFEF
ncbi:MAG: hypothetical protein PVG39_14605 [Desulfobacteraceae bacterium]|jgi:hypothetical protein